MSCTHLLLEVESPSQALRRMLVPRAAELVKDLGEIETASSWQDIRNRLYRNANYEACGTTFLRGYK